MAEHDDPTSEPTSEDEERPDEELEDLELDEDQEITERVRGGARRISIP